MFKKILEFTFIYTFKNKGMTLSRLYMTLIYYIKKGFFVLTSFSALS